MREEIRLEAAPEVYGRADVSLIVPVAGCLSFVMEVGLLESLVWDCCCFLAGPWCRSEAQACAAAQSLLQLDLEKCLSKHWGLVTHYHQPKEAEMILAVEEMIVSACVDCL